MVNIIPLVLADWVVIIIFLAILLYIGLYFSKKATGSLMEYFVAGKCLPWWLAGTSLVATSFAADTPLVISGWMRTYGLQRNWYWWSGVIAMMICTFFYARLWRRADIITDVEFTELRYHGRGAAVLRMFHAFFRATFQNCLVMGWVILAATTIIGVMFDIPTIVFMKNFTVKLFPVGVDVTKAVADPSMILFFMDEKVTGVAVSIAIALTYSVFAGLWGVIAADFFQFIIAMFGAIMLGVIVTMAAGGPTAMIAKAQELIASGAISNGSTKAVVMADQITRFTPVFDLSTGKMALIAFVIFISLQWIGGAQGGGFLSQRLFSCKNEKHSLLAMLWFNFAHFVLRPWPWILAGVASLVLIPKLPPTMNEEYAYSILVMNYLPAGLKGLMIASLLAAFMSTMDTHINFGASYLVNDLYKRFMKKNASEKHYIAVSQIATICVTILAGVFTFYYKTIAGAWFYFTELMSGAGIVVLLRWYWWRINVWSEISSMIASLILANTLRFIPGLEGDDLYPVRLAIIIFVSTIVWLIVTFLTKPEPEEHLEKFYKTVRPGGFWGPIAKKCGNVHPLHVGKLEFINTILGIGCVVAGLVGLGKICFGFVSIGIIYVAIAIVFGLFMFRNINRMDWEGILQHCEDLKKQ